MPEIVLIVLLVAFPVTGAVVRRWSVVSLPVIGVPLFYISLDRGWWGYGTGDGWQGAAVFFTIFDVVMTMIAVAIGRGLLALVRPGHVAR